MPEQLTFSLGFEGSWLPARPHAGAVKGSQAWTTRMSRENALQQPYIEAQATGVLQSFVITDVDTNDAWELPGLLGLPVPSWRALNPGTLCGHIGYTLGCPVCLTDAGNRRPVNLLARIESGFRTVLGGDVAYTGFLTKNPLHDDHLTLWGPDTAVYGLRELAKALSDIGALPAYNNRKALRLSNIGRNVDLFDLVRKWSYPRRGDYTNPTEWEEVVTAYAWDRNLTVIEQLYPEKGPMSLPESNGLARSIARWTWRNITRTLSKEQARRGRASAAVRAAKMDMKKADVKELAGGC